VAYFLLVSSALTVVYTVRGAMPWPRQWSGQDLPARSPVHCHRFFITCCECMYLHSVVTVNRLYFIVGDDGFVSGCSYRAEYVFGVQRLPVDCSSHSTVEEVLKPWIHIWTVQVQEIGSLTVPFRRHLSVKAMQTNLNTTRADCLLLCEQLALFTWREMRPYKGNRNCMPQEEGTRHE
jgi:hypothetical protein